MALLKEIKNESNGVITNYHRIIEYSVNKTKVLVLLGSYISELYRNKEKTAEERIVLIQSLWERIDVENLKENPNTEQIVLWTEELNKINLSETNSDTLVSKETIELIIPINLELSYVAIYEKLKQSDKFIGAEDII